MGIYLPTNKEKVKRQPICQFTFFFNTTLIR